MSGKYALIIANTEYTDPGLAQLTAPGKDAEDFARVLSDPEIGVFDHVHVLLNQPSYTAIEAIDEFFSQRKPDDLLVAYFSGHGVRDELGSLFLAVKNTNRSKLRSTAIRSDYIREAMDQSRSKRQVLILDCCNSGAFPQGTKAEVGGSMGMVSAFQGYGRYVLTASDATQFAWEGNTVIGETENSLFTHFLVKGLEGEADRDGDGKITVDELYDYAFDEIVRLTPKQKPNKSASRQEGEIILRQITRMEDIKPISLPEELVEAIEDTRTFVREGAVQQLAKILGGRNLGMARSAREALERIEKEDDSRRVSQAATNVLDAYRQVEEKAREEERAKAERLAGEKAEAERKAWEEAEKLLRAREEREAAERESARLRAERGATEKAAREAEEKVAREKAEKEAAERLVAQKAEEERIAKAQADRKAKEEAERIAAQKAVQERKERGITTHVETFPIEMKAEVDSAAPQKKLTFKAPIIAGIAVAAVVVFVLASFAIKALFNNAAPTATEAPLVSIPATGAPSAETTMTEAPIATTRKGGWLDEIIFSVVNSESALDVLQTGTIDIYSDGLGSQNFSAIRDAGLSYWTASDLTYDILYNPGACNNTSQLNPFSNRKIREATNWLYDRSYINEEFFAGASLEKLFPIVIDSPDYFDLADVVQQLEAKYVFDSEKAKEVITAEMEGMGATFNSDGRWEYGGNPVILIMLIRNDSDGIRVPIGDYVSNQLESVGFTVDRRYMTSREAIPLWGDSEPSECLWHAYTAAWDLSATRDQRAIFQEMYLPTSIQGIPVYKENVSDPAFQSIGDDLADGNFTTVEDRHELMTRALELSMEDSLQVWLIEGKRYIPYTPGLQAVVDISAFEVNPLPFTIRYHDREGGTVRWATSDLFIDPWNPVAGSIWIYDRTALYATQGGGILTDPSTGLTWPLRIEKAEVTVEKDLAVQNTLDWVTLEIAERIDVPADAWVDWDPTSQEFITAGTGATARVKSVVYYPNDLFETVKWHDGSPLSLGDFVMSMIMIFDPAKEQSTIYDETTAPIYDIFMDTVKGFRIVSTDPLIIEFYTDSLNLDAELNIYSMWPLYGYGIFGSGLFEAGWHVISISNMAESNGDLAYSSEKADLRQKEWMNFIGGASLDVLRAHLEDAASNNFIPYSPTMSQYVTEEEARIRYSNLKAWYSTHNHFWIGTGPYYLDSVSIEEKELSLKHFEDYPDLADRWSFLIR